MSKQTAAALKGDDPRPLLPLGGSWTVDASDLQTWGGLQFTAQTSGLLTGTVTVDDNIYAIQQGYISKDGKVKFIFPDNNGNTYIAKGTFNSTDNTIENGTLTCLSTTTDDTDVDPVNGTDDGTWSATSQGGNERERRAVT